MTAVISVSTNGSSVSASSSGGPLTSTITSFILGMNSLGAHIEFFGLYRADQVPDLVSASTASPPIPTGPNNLYADFVEGIYYLNGVVSSLGAIFTPTPYDGGAGNVNPANIIVDGEGLLIENYTSMPMDTGSSAELTTAGLDAAQALADLGAMAGILKYTIDSGSIGFGAYVFQMNASVGSLLIEDFWLRPREQGHGGGEQWGLRAAAAVHVGPGDAHADGVDHAVRVLLPARADGGPDHPRGLQSHPHRPVTEPHGRDGDHHWHYR